MALTKKSIKGLGALLSITAIAASGLLAVRPLYNQIIENQEKYENMQVITLTKESKVSMLENGVENIEETKAFVNRFLLYAPKAKSIETISRAISDATIEGVSISTFNFGEPENLKDYEIPDTTLEGYNPPVDLDAAARARQEEQRAQAEASEDGEVAPATAPEYFQRIPTVITVNASDHATLARYLDNLAQQDRLIVVVGIDTEKTDPEMPLSATIYAHAFMYATS